MEAAAGAAAAPEAAAAAAAAVGSAAAAAAASAASVGGDAALEDSFVAYMAPWTVLALSTLFAIHCLKFVLVPTLLGGLDYWTVISSQPDGEQQQQLLQAQLNSDGLSKKAGKKLQAQLKAAAAGKPSAPGGGGASSNGDTQQQVIHARLGPQLLSRMEFTEDLDHMLLVCFIAVINSASTALLKVWATPAFPQQVLHWSMFGLALVLYSLVKCEWSHAVIRPQDRAFIAVAAVVGALLAYTLLAVAPPDWLGLPTADAVHEVMTRMAAVAQTRLRRLGLDARGLEPVRDAAPLGGVLALIAGALSGLLLAPGFRYGRVLQALVEPPVWFLPRPTWRTRGAAQLGFMGQLLLVPLFVPVLTDALGVPRGQLPYVRGVAMLLVALLQAMALPHLVQAFLHATPVHMKVAHASVGATDAAKARSIKTVAQATLSQAGKVALQLAFVPTLLLLAGLLHLLMAFPSPLAASRPSLPDVDRAPSALFLTTSGFIGWWSSSVFVLWALLGGFLSRFSSMAAAA